MPREHPAEYPGNLRGRDEVAVGAELGGTRRVIPETRRIQGVVHEFGKTDAAACSRDVVAYERCRAFAVGGTRGIRLWQ